MLYDLSHEIHEETPPFPGEPAARLRQVARVEVEGWCNHRLELGMHLGTHLDGPAHMTPSPRCLSQIPIERLVGPAALLDARGEDPILPSAERIARIPTGGALLFRSDLDRLWGDPAYFERGPALCESWIEPLLAAGVKLIGMDWASPDRAPYPIHTGLLSREVLILENLTGLHQLPLDRPFELWVLPLKVRADSAPARVVARVEG